MRSLSIGSLLALMAALCFPSRTLAQESAAASAQSATPDLSGVWSLKGSPATRYFSYGFTKEEPPMTPWSQERFKTTKPSFGPRSFEDSNDPVNPTTVNAMGCFPPGLPRLYLQPFPVEFIQTAGRVMMFFEFGHYVRQIWTDGRKHNLDLGPTWLGDSIGHWEGDTLVVDTIGFNDKTWLDRAGHPHSDKLHLVERIHRVDANTMTDDLTIDDPIAYTKTWNSQLTFTVHPKWNIMEMVCEDNVNFDEFLKNEAQTKK